MSGWDWARGWLGDLLPEGTLRARFAKGTFWSLVGVVIAQALAFLSSLLVARIFGGREPYGELGMIRTGVAGFGVFAGLCLGMTLTKHVAQFRRADPERAGRLIGLSGMVSVFSASVMAATLFFIAPGVAATINAPQLVPEVRIGAILLFFEALNGVQTGALAGFEAFGTIAWVNFVRGLVTFPLMVGGAWFGGLRGVMWALALATAAGWLITHLVLRRRMLKEGIAARYDKARSELPVLWNFVLPAVLNNITIGPVLAAASAVLANQSEGYASLGVFNAAGQWQLPVMLLAAQFSATLLPMLSSFDLDEKGDRKSAAVLNAGVAGIAFTMLPIIAVVACFGDFVMRWYGAEFGGSVSASVLAAMVFVGGVRALGLIPGASIVSRGAMWGALVINAIWAAVLMTLVGLWAANGTFAFANAFSVSYTVSTGLALAYCGVKRIYPWSLVVRISLIAAAAFLFSYGMLLFASTAWKILLIAAAIGVGFGWAYIARREYQRMRRVQSLSV